LEDAVPEVWWHDWEPIKKQYRQGDAVAFRRPRGHVANAGFGKGQNHVWLEIVNRPLQLAINTQWPNPILIVVEPLAKKRAEAGFSQALERIRKPQPRVDEEIVGKVGVARDMKIKWFPLNQMPVHHDADTAVVARGHDAH